MTSFDPPRGGAYALHILVNRMDREADRILRADLDLTYPRFLLLLALRRIGPVTQRALAEELAVTEPTVSRTLRALAQRDLLTIGSVAGQGHRRAVDLTPAGRALVDRSAERLEAGFDRLLAGAGVTRSEVDRVTGRLLGALDTAAAAPAVGRPA